MQVKGSAALGFEPVADAFAASVEEVGEGGAAFAATLGGRPVVDLWVGRAGDRPWAEDTRAVLMSATKGVVTVVVARLVERGEVDVEAPVATYWPGFQANEKSEVTVGHLLSHAAGLTTVPGYRELLTPHGRGWDQTDEIVRRLEGAKPRWAPGTAVGYHGITFGWLTGTIIQRVTGRTVGAILRQELAEPLRLELELGTPVERQSLVAPVTLPDPDQPVSAEEEALARSEAWLEMTLAVDGRSLITDADVFFADPTILALELGGSNATGTARGLARLYGALAGGGEIDGIRVLSPETIEEFASERISGRDRVLQSTSRYGLGFARPVPESQSGAFSFGPADEAFGHAGMGGQLGFADPVRGVGVGFVRSHLSERSPLGPDLVAALYDCLPESGRILMQ